MHYRNQRLHFGSITASELVETYGSPLYVYEADVVTSRIDELRRTVGSVPVELFYAAKANSNTSILAMFADAGFGCDAVSPGEVFLARSAGFDDSRIWFTCSNVSPEDLRFLRIHPEIVVNLNSRAELDTLIESSLENPVSFRVNTEVGAGHHKDVVTGGFGVKFGIEATRLIAARDDAVRHGHRVTGLHAHIGSGIHEPEPLLESARRLVALADDFPDLEQINFGGGLGVAYYPGQPEFDLEGYAQGLRELTSELARERGIRFIIEPGRYPIAPAGILLSRVTTRRTSAGYAWIGCDTGFNHLARPSRYDAYHHILNATSGSDEWLKTNLEGSPFDDEGGVLVAGNICESGDVFTRHEGNLRPRRMPETNVGDILAFCDAGAYGYSMGSHYNSRLLPAEVMISGSEVKVIRQRQTYQSLLAGQVSPEELPRRSRQ